MNEEKKELSYWNKELKNLKDNEKYIWDYYDESSFEKRRYKEVFDKNYGTKLSDICKNSKLLIYTFLVSTLKITLSKYMMKNSTLIGIPYYNSQNNNNKNVQLNKLLPLTSYIDDGTTYLEYMTSIKSKLLECYRNQAYLNSKVLLENNLSNDVMELMPISICMNGLHEDKDINYICESIKNELSFLIDIMEDKSINIDIVYKSNKIAESTVKTLCESYIIVLKDVLNNYNKKIKDIKILSEKDINKILFQFNDTKENYPKDKTIQELFEAQVETTPDNIAVIFEDKKLTYRELNQRANILARVLRNKGVKADSIVAIMLERSLEMIIGIIGILKSGGAYLPIDPNYPKERIEFVLNDSDSKVLLSKNTFVKEIEFNGEIIDLFNEVQFNEESSNLEKVNNSSNLAYVIYTSGTTGTPKGAMIEHRALVNRLNWMQKKYPLSEDDIILQKTTYTFDVSVWELLWWSLVGAKVCMLNPNDEKDPIKIIEAIKKYGITTMHFVPSMLDLFLYCVEENRDVLSLKSLRQVFSSGEALNFKQVSKFYKEFDKNNKLINLYGPTEATIDVSYFDCNNNDIKVIPIGKPIDNTKLYILRNNEFVPIGVSGEIYIAGDGLARGYLNRQELTTEKFVDNPFDVGTKMYKTGDLARWLPDGNIEFLGRIDNQVKIRGFRIELGEIENRLLQHGSIKEATVLVKENNEKEKYICAYVVTNAEISSLDLRRYLAKSLPKYMIPARYIQLKKIPLGSTGKLDRKALLLYDVDNGVLENTINDKNQVEETLAVIWSKVLYINKDEILPTDDFFELGGNSLDTINLINMIDKYFNLKITTKEVFLNYLLKEQSELIKNKLLFINSIIEVNDYIKKYISKDINIDFSEMSGVIKISVKDEWDKAKVCKYIYDNYGENLKESITFIDEKKITKEIDKVEIFEMISNIIKNNQQIKQEFENGKKIKCSDSLPTLLYHMNLKNKVKVESEVELNLIDLEEVKIRLKRLVNKHELLRTYITKTKKKYSFVTYDKINEIPLYTVNLSQYSYKDVQYVKRNILNKITEEFMSKQVLNELLWMIIIFKENDSYTIDFILDHKICDAFTRKVIERDLLRESHKILSNQLHSYFEYTSDTRSLQTQEKINHYYHSDNYNELKDSIYKYYTNINRDGYINNVPIIFKYTIKEDIREESKRKEEIALDLIVKICGILFDIRKVPIKVVRNGRIFNNINYSDTIGDFHTRLSIPFSIDDIQNKNNYNRLIEFEEEYYVNNGMNFECLMYDNLGFDTYEISEVIKKVPIIYNFLGEAERLEEIEKKDLENYLDLLMTTQEKGKYKIKAKTSKQSIYLVLQYGIRDDKLNEILSLGLEKFS